MNKILVTGGCGFIGHHLVLRYLEKNPDSTVFVIDDMSNACTDFQETGLRVRSIYAGLVDGYSLAKDSLNPQVVVIEGDFSHPKVLGLLVNYDFQAVFHFAAQPRVEVSVKEPVAVTNENLNKTLELARACAQVKVRLVFSSTSAIYGNTTELPTSESTQHNPANPYGLSKYCAEQYMSMFEDLYGLDWVALRYFNVYGPGQVGDSPYCTAIAAWCHKAKHGSDLRSDGDGEQTRDMVYVVDIADANILCSTAILKHRIYNVGTGASVSNNWLLQKFAERGYTTVIHAPARVGDVRHTLADTSLLNDDLGWRPDIDISTGLELTWKWWGL